MFGSVLLLLSSLYLCTGFSSVCMMPSHVHNAGAGVEEKGFSANLNRNECDLIEN